MKSAFFIAHGAPTIFLEDTAYTQKLKAFKQDFPQIKRLLFFSAHNDSPKLKVAASKDYSTIHDFYGFPQALYDVKMETKGDPEFALNLSSYLKNEGIDHDVLTQAGIDHGVWTILKLMDPDNSLPLVNLSISSHADPKVLIALGEKLNEFTPEDTAIVFSGGLLHNLRAVNFGAKVPDPWAGSFNQAMDAALLDSSPKKLFEIFSHPSFKMAAPTLEHFIGIFIVYGTILKRGTAQKLAHTITYGNLGLDYWHFKS